LPSSRRFLKTMPKIQTKSGLFSVIERSEAAYIDLARKLWDNPELSYEEKESSELQKSLCRSLGFNVRELDDLQPYSFVAEYGTGKKTVGFLGEFDALPGLSQKVSCSREAVIKGGPGHGCGHNLLGTACIAATAGLKEAIESRAVSGKVRYFGCPAEEQLGKSTLAKAGVFDGVDAMLCWHPADINTVAAYTTNAAVQLRFEFKGEPSHAAQVPHLGRSALDAVTLMNVGVEFLREHIPQFCRIHYIVDSGGERPNIVPHYASAVYQMRGPRMSDVLAIVTRVLAVAKGAAMMTGTTMDYSFLTGCHDFLPNKVLSELLYGNLKTVPLPLYTEEDRQLAFCLFETNEENQRAASLETLGLDASSAMRLARSVLHEGVGYWGEDWTIPASTDVGDVSHITPTGQILAATWPIGVGTHTWQATASAGSGIGMKGMLYAAKVLAGTAWDLLENPANLDFAKNEFFLVQGKEVYKSARELIDAAAMSL